MSEKLRKYLVYRLPYVISFALASIVASEATKGGLWLNIIAVMMVATLPFYGALIGAGVGNLFGTGRPVILGWQIGLWGATTLLTASVATSLLFY
jgi:uncharacterized membrane protein